MSMPVYLILITSLLTLVCSNAKPKGGFENKVFETQDKTTKNVKIKRYNKHQNKPPRTIKGKINQKKNTNKKKLREER